MSPNKEETDRIVPPSGHYLRLNEERNRFSRDWRTIGIQTSGQCRQMLGVIVQWHLEYCWFSTLWEGCVCRWMAFIVRYPILKSCIILLTFKVLGGDGIKCNQALACLSALLLWLWCVSWKWRLKLKRLLSLFTDHPDIHRTHWNSFWDPGQLNWYWFELLPAYKDTLLGWNLGNFTWWCIETIQHDNSGSRCWTAHHHSRLVFAEGCLEL